MTVRFTPRVTDYMWPFSRKSRSHQAGSSTEKLMWCSFCGKTQDDVRKLIAGPTVYICNECINLCNDIIAEEFGEQGQRQAMVTAQVRRAPVGPLHGCVLCRLPKEPEEMIYIPDRGPLCNVCLDAIRAVTETSEDT